MLLEQVLSEMMRKVSAAAVYCQSAVTKAETASQRVVAKAVEAQGGSLMAVWGSQTLYCPDKLPFRIPDMPTSFGASCLKSAVSSQHLMVATHAGRRCLDSGTCLMASTHQGAWVRLSLLSEPLLEEACIDCPCKLREHLSIKTCTTT